MPDPGIYLNDLAGIRTKELKKVVAANFTETRAI
jgi:hypothetical protein